MHGGLGRSLGGRPPLKKGTHQVENDGRQSSGKWFNRHVIGGL